MEQTVMSAEDAKQQITPQEARLLLELIRTVAPALNNGEYVQIITAISTAIDRAAAEYEERNNGRQN